MKLAIIPARGGSKRIPRKNIKNFAGKPMIQWVIDAVLQSNQFDYVLCSTDDEEIADVARTCGARVPNLRPPELSDDFTPTRAVIQHAIGVGEEVTGEKVEYACCVYATAAFVTAQDIKTGFDTLQKGGKSFAFAATRYAHPVQRAFTWQSEGGVTMAQPETSKTRTQDLAPHFHDVGMFYWGTRDGFYSDTPMFSTHSDIVEIPAARAHDIDEPDDWELAELVFQTLQRKLP